MKLLTLFLVLTSFLLGSQSVPVGEKFQSSQQCKACHYQIVQDWSTSWHAKSHYQNDEYFQKTIEYLHRKTRKSLSSIQVQCATCHNPRISVTSTDINFEIATLMGLNKDSKVKEALQSEVIGEGINCVVCHNIDKIHTDAPEDVRGINRVEWTKAGVMSGPYDDASSPYHKVEHREFMDEKSNLLCFVCHANDRSVDGVVFTDMKSEFIHKDNSCVDCHMSEKKKGVASTIRDTSGKTKEREIRAHKFEGAHTSKMWINALELMVTQMKQDLVIEITNPQPHNIPSGFGARELLLEVVFKSDKKVVAMKSISLTRQYISKRDKPTIPHLALKMGEDMSIPAESKKVLKTAIAPDALIAEVTLYYVLVNPEVRSLLNLEEKIWSEKHLITKGIATLKQ
jgi:hypothetical protein